MLVSNNFYYHLIAMGMVMVSLIVFYLKNKLPLNNLIFLDMDRLVGDVNIVVEKTRVDKSQVRLAECEVGDETGTLSLRARDDQINLLQEIASRNGAVVLRNCSLELFQGKYIRLAISKWGKIHAFPDGISSTPSPPSKMNSAVHLSIVDLNEVAGEDWNESLQSQGASGRGAIPGSASSDSYTSSRDKHHGHGHGHGRASHSPRNRHSRRPSDGRGQAGYDRRNNRHKGAGAAPGQGYNPNVVQVVPAGMPSLPLYAAPQYNYGRFDQHAMQNPYLQQHQQQNQQHQHQHQAPQDDFAYLSYQEYTMRMQMEAMRLSYSHQQQQQHQHQHQHQNRTGSHVYHQLSPTRGLQQDHIHNPASFIESQGRNQTQFQAHESAQTHNISQQTMSQSSSVSVSTVPGSHLSPGSSYAPPMNDTDGWSIRQEAESPMMNPHAAVFNSAYSMPSKYMYIASSYCLHYNI